MVLIKIEIDYLFAYDQALFSLPTASHLGLKQSSFTIPIPRNEIHRNLQKVPLSPLTVRQIISDLPTILNGRVKSSGITAHRYMSINSTRQNHIDFSPLDPELAHLEFIFSKVNITKNH